MCPDTLQNTRLGCHIQVDVLREHMGYVHAVSLSWQDSPELAETYFLPTGLTYGSTEGACVEAFHTRR